VSLSVASMPCRRALEKCRQHLQFGKYLRANGLQSRPVGAYPERLLSASRRSTQLGHKKKVIYSVHFDMNLLSSSSLLGDLFPQQVLPAGGPPNSFSCENSEVPVDIPEVDTRLCSCLGTIRWRSHINECSIYMKMRYTR
jgi:hypothetical protein